MRVASLASYKIRLLRGLQWSGDGRATHLRQLWGKCIPMHLPPLLCLRSSPPSSFSPQTTVFHLSACAPAALRKKSCALRLPFLYGAQKGSCAQQIQANVQGALRENASSGAPSEASRWSREPGTGLTRDQKKQDSQHMLNQRSGSFSESWASPVYLFLYCRCLSSCGCSSRSPPSCKSFASVSCPGGFDSGKKKQHKHKLFSPDFLQTFLTLTPGRPWVKKILPITGCERPRLSAQTSMTRRVLEKLCTETVCVDFLAPIDVCGLDNWDALPLIPVGETSAQSIHRPDVPAGLETGPLAIDSTSLNKVCSQSFPQPFVIFVNPFITTKAHPVMRGGMGQSQLGAFQNCRIPLVITFLFSRPSPTCYLWMSWRLS